MARSLIRLTGITQFQWRKAKITHASSDVTAIEVTVDNLEMPRCFRSRERSGPLSQSRVEKRTRDA